MRMSRQVLYIFQCHPNQISEVRMCVSSRRRTPMDVSACARAYMRVRLLLCVCVCMCLGLYMSVCARARAHAYGWECECVVVYVLCVLRVCAFYMCV